MRCKPNLYFFTGKLKKMRGGISKAIAGKAITGKFKLDTCMLQCFNF